MVGLLQCIVLYIVKFHNMEKIIVNNMEEIQYRYAPISVIISMLAGIFVISGGLMLFAMLNWYGSTLMMGGQWHMYMFTYPRWLTGVMAATSILAGGLIISASYKMYKEPKKQVMGTLDYTRIACEPSQRRRIWLRWCARADRRCNGP